MNFIKATIFLFLFFLSFLTGQKVLASQTIYSQTESASSTVLNTSGVDYIGQFFYNQAIEEINDLDLLLCRISDFTASETTYIRVGKNSNQNDPNWTNTLTLVFSEGLAINDSTKRNPNDVIPLCDGTSTPSLATNFINRSKSGEKLTNNTWYFVYIYSSGWSSGDKLRVFSQDGGSTFGVAEETMWSYSGSSNTEYANSDLYFSLNGIYKSHYVNFQYPENNGIYKPFSNWQVIYSASTTSSNDYSLKLEYGNTTSMTETPIIEPVANSMNVKWTFGVPATLNEGVYYARISLLTGTSTVVASSSQITVTVNDTSGVDINEGITGFTASDITSTSTGDLSGYLQGTLNLFSKFYPFNLGVNIYNSWTDSETEEIPAELSFLDVVNDNGDIVYDFQDILDADTSTPVILFGSTTFNSVASSTDFYSDIRTLSGYLMYALFIFSLKKRGEHYYNELKT